MIISPVQSLGGTADTFCLSNQAVAKVDTNQANDTAQFCVEKTTPQMTKGGLAVPTPTPGVPNNTKGGLPVYQQPTTTKTPSTGAEALLLPLFGLVGSAGFLLRKHSINFK